MRKIFLAAILPLALAGCPAANTLTTSLSNDITKASTDVGTGAKVITSLCTNLVPDIAADGAKAAIIAGLPPAKIQDVQNKATAIAAKCAAAATVTANVAAITPGVANLVTDQAVKDFETDATAIKIATAS